MVLRVIAFTFFLAWTSQSFGMLIGREEKLAFSKAKQLYKDKLYHQVIEMLSSKFQLHSDNTPSGALTLAAYSYEKLEDYGAAIKLYYSLIKANYKDKNSEILQSYKTNGTDDLPEAPNKLYLYYHRIAESMARLYLRDYGKLNQNEKETIRKRVSMYVEILGESDYDNDSYDTINERLEKHDKYLVDKVFHSSWFLSTSYISYRNQLSIERQSDGLVVPINSTVDGICIGGGWRYQSAFWEYNLNGCYSAATMNVDTDSSITYQQSGVASTTFLFGPSVLWKPKSGDVSIGIHIPFIYNTGDYTVPAGYTISDDTLLTYGYFLETNWKLSSWGIFTKFGKAAQFKSSLWMVGITLGL